MLSPKVFRAKRTRRHQKRQTVAKRRIRAERAFNQTLNGGCQVPIAGYAELEGEQIYLRGLVGKPDGSEILRAEIRGSSTQAHELGVQLAQQLLARGADRILAALQATAQAESQAKSQE